MPTATLQRYGTDSHTSYNATRHRVLDHVMQIEVFHWYGPTGAEKCTAVADALNALKHEKD